MVPPERRSRKDGTGGRELTTEHASGRIKNRRARGARRSTTGRAVGYCRAWTSKLLMGSVENTVSFGSLGEVHPVGRSMGTWPNLA